MRLDLMKLRSVTQRSARHVDNVSLSLSSTISLFPAVLCCHSKREGMWAAPTERGGIYSRVACVVAFHLKGGA